MEVVMETVQPEIFLGFADDEAPLDPERDFPDLVNGKVGGKPVWLEPEHLPPIERLLCAQCGKPMSFLMQIYAPHEKILDAFHRTIFVFCCQDGECHKDEFRGRFKVLRSQLPENNPYYTFDSKEEHWAKNPTPRANSCRVCGCLGSKFCGSCKVPRYCSKDHQVHDWKMGHKEECKKLLANLITASDLSSSSPSSSESTSNDSNPTSSESSSTLSSVLFPEFELVTEKEEKIVEKEEDLLNDPSFAKKVKKAEESEDVDESFFGTMNKDKAFLFFQKTVKPYPDQCLRYYGWEKVKPLSVSDQNEANEDDVPKCEKCGSNRIPEFQILPQLLNKLRVDKLHGETLDWGILTIYTCEKSCDHKHNENDVYLEEFIWRQNFSNMEINK